MIKEVIKNPLIRASEDRNAVVPFDEIETAHFIPALKWGIQKAQERIKNIKNISNPNFENVIEAWEDGGYEVKFISSVFTNMTYAHSNAALKAIEPEFNSILTKFIDDMVLNNELFARIAEVHSQADKLNLTDEQNKLLKDTFRYFQRSGVELKNADKKRLRQINAELSALVVDFTQNIMCTEDRFEYWVTDKTMLAGLTDELIAVAKKEATAKGRPNDYLFRLETSTLKGLMIYAENRALREEFWRGFQLRGTHPDFDNRPIILKMIALKHERACLLGYKNHADYVLEERMAKNTATVERMLENLKNVVYPVAVSEHLELEAFAAIHGLSDDIKPWDILYYKEKLRQDIYDIKAQDIKPYFEYNNVLNGAFEVASRLYDLRFEKNETASLPHPETESYNVYDVQNGEKLALLYTDFFSRPGKRAGAWMHEYRQQSRLKTGERVIPIISIHGNFQLPIEGHDALLSYENIITLYHEVGHALHGLLSDVRYATQAGLNVKWDFVELPSQVFENWVDEPDVLKLFAFHHKTGEVISDDVIERLRLSRNFHAASDTLYQLRLGTLDMAWHTTSPREIDTVEKFEGRVTWPFDIVDMQGGLVSPAFVHIFACRYAAGFYSYKWAEILGADVFEVFSKKGIFDKETADRFKLLLKRAGSVDPNVLYRDFRGRDADAKALLRRSGLFDQEHTVLTQDPIIT